MEEVVEEKDNKPVKEKREFKAILIYIAGLIISEFIVSFVLTLKFGRLTVEKLTEIQGIYTALNLMTYSVIILAAFIILYHKRLKSDFKKINKKMLLKLLLYGIGFYIVNIVLGMIFINILEVETNNQDAIQSSMNSLAIVSFLPTALFAPLIEEIVFRFAISTIIKNKVVFVIVSSLLFALIHGVGVITILYFVLGVMFALIYLRFNKNIFASALVHMFNNTVSSILMLIL